MKLFLILRENITKGEACFGIAGITLPGITTNKKKIIYTNQVEFHQVVDKKTVYCRITKPNLL
jgi:hypothetical protein